MPSREPPDPLPWTYPDVPALAGRLTRRAWLSMAAGLAACGPQVFQPPSLEPLSKWNDGPARRAILDFVRRVTEPGPTFVRPEARVAVFDNDGTLWAEQPLYFQAAFAIDKARKAAATDPKLGAQAPFKTLLSADPAAQAGLDERDLVKIVEVTHSGMTTEAFDAAAREWLATARHPRFQRLYGSLVYAPQLELLSYLRANAFKVYIVSGGGVGFIRAFAWTAYGVPPEQVIGSSGKTRFKLDGDRAELVKLPEIGSVDDGPGKPSNIDLHIGRRPILAFGNSDGDLAMLEYATGAPTPGLGLLLHHDDPAREYAYDRNAKVGALDKALDEAAGRGWVVVSMRRDWRTVFPPPEATR